MFEDNEGSDQDDYKGKKSHNETCFQDTQRCALIGYSIELIWTPKIQIKFIDTKNQLADMLTKEHFTRDEWNHLLCMFNISHFSSTDCSDVMSKRKQEESSEERVTAKSKPMMNLSRDAAKGLLMRYLLLHQKARRKPSHESQFLLSLRTEQHHRIRRPVEDAYSSNYSE